MSDHHVHLSFCPQNLYKWWRQSEALLFSPDLFRRQKKSVKCFTYLLRKNIHLFILFLYRKKLNVKKGKCPYIEKIYKKIKQTKKDININDLHVLVSGPVPKELLRHLQKDQSINPDIKPSETKVKASGELLNWFHLLVAMFGLANRLLLPVFCSTCMQLEFRAAIGAETSAMSVGAFWGWI